MHSRNQSLNGANVVVEKAAMIRGKRRWLQFNLRTLLLASAGIALWLGVVVNRTRQQREIIRLVRELGGEIVYDFQYTGIGEPPGPQWLREVIGEDYFGTVEGVSIGNLRLTDEQLEQVCQLRRLRILRFFSPAVTDEGIATLGNCSRLEELEIRYAAITDRGIDHIARLPRLKRLLLNNTEITDAGLAKLRALPRLHTLSVGNFWPTNARTIAEQSTSAAAEITDDGLISLAAIPSLKEVWLLATPVTSAGQRAFSAKRPDVTIHETHAQSPYPNAYWERILPKPTTNMTRTEGSRISLAPAWEPKANE